MNPALVDHGSPAVRFPLWLGLLASLVYAAIFVVLAWLWFSKSSFDAIFLLGLIGTPTSLLANAISGALGQLIFQSRNLSFDLVLLFLFGAAQYFALGYLVGRALAFLFSRK